MARELAAEGWDLLVTARRQNRLDVLRDEIEGKNGVSVHVVAADLADETERAGLLREVARHGTRVGALVHAAGSASWSVFAEQKPLAEAKRAAVATTATVELVGSVWPSILKHDKGLLLVVSSLAAWQPTPYMATYAAGKAFQRSFVEALAAEARAEQSSAAVLVLCPGPVDTEFAWVAGTQALAERVPVLQPVQLARDALHRAYSRPGRGPAFVPGWRNKISATAASILPRRLVTSVSERNHRPR